MNIEEQIVNEALAAKSILITSHKSADGDSVGSSLALYHFLKKLNLEVSICHPDPAAAYLKWMPSYAEVLNFEEHAEAVTTKFQQAELIFSLDYNEPSRIGNPMSELLTSSKAKKILIDHHLNPSDFADIILSDTSSCSTCQLIYQVIEKSGKLDLLDETIATPIYAGLVTDSGSFRFNSVKPYTHRIAAHLLEVGVQNDYVHEKLFDDNTLDKLKLKGFATSEKLVVLEDLQTAYISLSQEELNRFIHEKGDTEGLVNVALSIVGVKIAAFFAEKEDGIKISFRSKGKDHPVNTLARDYFSGGGHANAAGGIFFGNLDDAIALFKQNLPKYVS